MVMVVGVGGGGDRGQGVPSVRVVLQSLYRETISSKSPPQFHTSSNAFQQ